MADGSIAIPEPYSNVDCQSLVWDSCSHSGWLRKRTRIAQDLSKTGFNLFRKFQRKFIPWLQKYVVLSQGCIYCFNHERAKSPSTAFTLYGFTSVMRAGPDICKEEATWVFKLIHVHQKRIYWFSAASEADMKMWMKKIRKEIKNASCLLHKELGNKSSTSENSDDDSDEDYSRIEEPVINAILAKKVAQRAGNAREIEETADDEEKEYMKVAEVEQAIAGHRKPSKDKGKKAKVPQPPDMENADELSDLPKGCPVPLPRKVKMTVLMSDEDVNDHEEGEVYDDNVVSSVLKERPPLPVPDKQGDELQLPYDDVDFSKPKHMLPVKDKQPRRRRSPPRLPSDSVSPSEEPPLPAFPKTKALPSLPKKKKVPTATLR